MTGMAWASSPVTFTAQMAAKAVQVSVQMQDVINWKKGDQNVYALDMGFIQGSMTQTVRDIVAEGIWVDQDMDMGFAGKQQAQELIDPATGAVKKILVGGKEQQLPQQGDQEVVKVEEANIQVPAGTFDCIHAQIKDKKSGDITEAWINPDKVSIGGMIKVIQPSQFGKVTISLKSFTKN
jgi:hypothetical protein